MLLRGFILACLATFIFVGQAQAADLIVVRNPGLSKAERTQLRADAGVRYRRSLPLPRTEVVSTDNPQRALRELRADPDVKSAEPDYIVHKQAKDTYFDDLWALPKIAATNFWNKTRGSGVTVAVVDTGIQYDHPDLANQIATNPGELGSGKETNGIDDDGNGYVDDYRGWNFVANNNTPNDDDSHGSHVSGTIAAEADNGLGVAGVANQAKVMPLKALNAQGSGTWSNLILAFDYAGDLGIPVVNASLGALLSSSPSESLLTTINSHPDTLYVIAAGNDGLDLDVAGRFEAPCEEPAANLICVGASDENDDRASFSNFGLTSVDIFAPGVNILSTVPGSLFGYSGGTSMASPHVAAAATLLKADNPSLNGAQLKTLLMNSSATIPALTGLAVSGRLYLGGLVDSDGDGFYDAADNCPNNANAPQTDSDSDGIGNACDSTPNGPDRDSDGVPDSQDNCPDNANGDQANNDGDSLGNVCDSTPNGGGSNPSIPDKPNTNCGKDSDGDGIGDSCDSCPSEVANLCLVKPQIVILASAKKKRLSAQVTVSTASRVKLTLQRKVGRKYKKVKTASAEVDIAESFTFTKLRAGSYRLLVTATNNFGQSQSTRSVKVR